MLKHPGSPISVDDGAAGGEYEITIIYHNYCCECLRNVRRIIK